MPTNLKVTSQPLISPKIPAPSRLASPTEIRNSGQPFSKNLARDMELLSQSVNDIQKALKTPVTVSQILLTDQLGNVVAAFGDFLYKGVFYTNYLNELHVGDPLHSGDPQKALLNANTDGSVTIGQNGWLDVLDPFGNDAAWIGTQNDTNPVSGAVDNGSGKIRLTVAGHNLVTGNSVRVQGIQGIGTVPPNGGAFVDNSTGIWTVTVVDASTIDLNDSVFAGAYAGRGMVDRLLQITGVANNGSGLVRVTTAVAHNYETGDQVSILNAGSATGQWIITVVDATHFDLNGSAFTTASAAGTCLRYFAGILAQTVAIGASFAGYNLREFADGSLKIKNASFTLVNGGNTIVLDPTGPSIKILPAAGGSIVLDATGITVTNPSGNHITLSASTGNISSTGLLNAGGATEDVTIPSVPPVTLHFVNGVYTGHS